MNTQRERAVGCSAWLGEFVAYDPVINRRLTVQDICDRDAQGALQRLARGVRYWWLEKARLFRECFDEEHRAARRSARRLIQELRAKGVLLPPPRKRSTIAEEVASLASDLPNAEVIESLSRERSARTALARLGLGQDARNPSPNYD